MNKARPDVVDRLLQRIGWQVVAEDERNLATFLQRAIARLVDTAAVMAIAYALQEVFIYFLRKGNIVNEAYVINSVKEAIPALALILWVIVYSPVLESTGGTLGKRLVGIRLVELKTGQIPPFRTAAARAWIYLIFVVLFVVPAVVSCLAYFISDYRQTWHDKLTGLICIKTVRRPAVESSAKY
ncbi:MAG: RDD family protein [Chitinophagales bacterium]|nr:RDD family protein [Chitinophagales bacterium]MDW8428502.1 RDD family protein [Chitinophagales bacterium]